MSQLHIDFCQRWRDRAEVRVPAGDADPRRPIREVADWGRYGVEVCSFAEAKGFVVQHHYSGTMPSARLSVGMYRASRVGGVELVGVAVFSVPMSQRVVPRWLGVEPDQGIELGRLVLLDEVPGNAESWFVRRALDIVRDELGVRAVLACSDPVRRVVQGRLVMPGHAGTVYQALNAVHLGRTTRRTLALAPCGTIISGRALSKIRGGERGRDYAISQLLDLGAPRLEPGETGAQWVTRLRSSGWLGRARHPGCIAYAWALGDKRERRAVRSRWSEPLPYPKARDVVRELEVRSAA